MDLPGPTEGKPMETIVNTGERTGKSPARPIHVNPRMPLTTKRALELLLEGALKYKVCRYCMELASPLFELDQIMSVAGRGAMYDVTIRDMVATVHPFKVQDEPDFPNKICNKCVNKAIRSYLFAQQCEQAARALRNCFDDIYEKLNKLDPLHRVQKRGRQKLHPNNNKLYTEHQIVLDYAEPIRHLINTDSVSYTNESAMGDLECKKCWQVLPNKESLVNHGKSHPKTMWYHCRLCGKSFAKSNQLKKHVKLFHESNMYLPEKDKFECKKCRFISDNHILHLQHMEKHKFQSVVEHIVERKMDRLCAVCYDKDNKLVELDKVISLHGGYPELTGERSLYNILGCTLPENKSYKYQELFVPYRANVITITKRSDAGFDALDKQNQAKTSTGSSFMDKQHFDVSLPVIISTENIDCHDLYLFTFSNPLNLVEIDNKEVDYKTPVLNDSHEVFDETNEVQFNGIKMNFNTPTQYDSSNKDEVDLTNDDHRKYAVRINSTDVQKEKLTLNFPDSEYENHIVETGKCEVKAVDSKEISEEGTVCKVCWIYNKPSCEKCIGPKINHDEDLVKTVGKAEVKTDTCSFCWIFKNADRCDYCKKLPKECVTRHVNTSKNDETYSKIVSKSTNVSRGKKRKIVEDIEIKAKKSKWQCLVCLTSNNANRETCICCDSGIYSENLVKFNFGTNKNSFFNHAHKSEDKHPLKSTVNEDVVITIAKNNDHGILSANDEFKETQYSIKLIDQSDNMEAHNIDNMDTAITCKEIPITAANMSIFNEISKHQERMDIEEVVNNESIHILTPPNSMTSTNLFPNTPNLFSNISQAINPLPNIDSNISNIKPTSFQFNVGSGQKESKGKDGRKYMRHLRRNATAFHKS